MFPHGHHRYYPPQPHFAPPPPPLLPGKRVEVQSVTACNFLPQLDAIGSLLHRYPYVVVDTEYPGTVHRPPAGQRESDLTADERYALVKANVDELPAVLLGITLCDARGDMPFYFAMDYRTGHAVAVERAWEINFSDFDARRHRGAPLSVDFLRSQGVNFDSASAFGVSAAAFGNKLSQVLAAYHHYHHQQPLTWVAFGGAYDLAYLVKMLSGGVPLPGTRQEFAARVRALLGGRVFDAKVMADRCGRQELRDAGLRTVAAELGVPWPIVVDPDLRPPHANAPPPQRCLAGPKSLTACRIYKVLSNDVLSQEAAAAFQGLIDGLH